MSAGERGVQPVDGGGGRVLVRQVRSHIGTKPKHRGTLRALGLGHLGDQNVLVDRPDLRGMLARVPHLVTVEALDGAPGAREGTSVLREGAE